MNNKYLQMGLGILGLVLVIIGTFFPPALTQKLFFLFGGLFLLVSSILAKDTFFVILEIIVFVGTLVALFPISGFAKISFPIALTALAIVYLAKQGMLKDYVNMIGCLGLLFLAAGFAVVNPVVYFLGGLTLTIYSTLSYRRSGAGIALLFAILNAVFTVTSAIGMFKMFF